MKDIKLDALKKTLEQPREIPIGFHHSGKKHRPFFRDHHEILSNFRRLSNEQKKDLLLKDPKKVIISSYQGDEVVRWDLDKNYRYSFNYRTGYAVRTDLLDDAFKATGKDPFSANFPQLIDVGVMGSCRHGLSGLCMKSGVQCYQSGAVISRPNMNLDDFKRIAKECANLTNQFALGGRGDPNEHEQFGEILRICRENNIVPNYTTSGFELTDEEIALSKSFCGAVAVSWYRRNYTLSAIRRLIAAGVKTNIHFVLNKDTIDEGLDLLENNKFPKGINAVVFLAHKPVGLGEKDKCLSPNDNRLQEIFRQMKIRHPFKTGIDSCLAVGLFNSNLNFDTRFFDSCEAARFTCYIDAQMKMHPCSFDVLDQYAVDLKEQTIAQGWNSETFNKVRGILQLGCPGCKFNDFCHGGCFLERSVVLCSRKEKK